MINIDEHRFAIFGSPVNITKYRRYWTARVRLEKFTMRLSYNDNNVFNKCYRKLMYLDEIIFRTAEAERNSK